MLHRKFSGWKGLDHFESIAELTAPGQRDPVGLRVEEKVQQGSGRLGWGVGRSWYL